jgi:predicted lipid-binding transport protein (Tim44 family)
MAFEMVINAFSKEDYDTLKILLSENLYEGFKKSIDDRKANNQALTTNLISINECEIKSALLIDNMASIVLKINSKQINYILDKQQNLIHGSKEEIHDVNDIWTFKKNIKDNNPNWIIFATSSN